MNDPSPSWDLHRSLLAVLREGTLSGAARALGLTQPTIGRHIEVLEESLGVALFVRSRAGLLPTEAALELRPYAEALEATAAALLRTAAGRGNSTRGVVRVTASDVIGVEVLPRILTGLRRRNPELAVELVATNEVEDLMLRKADVAVRMTPPTQAALVAKKVGTVRLGLFARRDYLEAAGTPTDLDGLLCHTLIGFDTETAFIRDMRARGVPLDRDRLAFRSDSDLALIAMLRAGYGIGFCQIPLARRDPDLIPVMPERIELGLDTWVAMHEDLRANTRCRVTFDALVEGLTDYLA